MKPGRSERKGARSAKRGDAFGNVTRAAAAWAEADTADDQAYQVAVERFRAAAEKWIGRGDR